MACPPFKLSIIWLYIETLSGSTAYVLTHAQQLAAAQNSVKTQADYCQ
jgi:hypothetical protein